MTDATDAPDGFLSAGRVGRPHGLDGSFYVTQPRTRMLALGAVVTVAGADIEVVRCDGTAARPILRLAGRGTRAAIESLRGADLWVERALVPPLDADEWYAEDLVGCAVVDGDRVVGVVTNLLAYPSCELLEVSRDGAPDLLVPMIDDAVGGVDVVARRIEVRLDFLGEPE